MSTKTCELCDATIGETDKECPACGADLEAVNEQVEAVERANKILEKRKAKAAPPVPPTPTPQPQPEPKKKQSVFSKLALKKKGS